MATKKNATKAQQPTGPETAKDAAPVAKKAATKAATKAVDKTATPATKQAVVKAAKLSPDALARAAYLNYRRRVEQGLPGDPHGDWLEAERHYNKPGAP